MKEIILGTLAIFVLAINGSTIPQGGSRVENGIDAKQGDLPFVVSVHQDTKFLCSGVLIDVYWVLTSANCVYSQTDPLKVSVGGVLHTVPEVGRYDIRVDTVTVHDDFYTCLNGYATSYYYCNNMALLKLTTPAIPSIMLHPITLTDPTEVTPAKTKARFAGWGGNTNTSPSPKLQSSDYFDTMTTADCSDATGITMSELDICTERAAPYACEFDQGGPLFKLDSRGYVLVGILNYAPCGNGFPNIYASATGQRWWIQKVTGV